MSRLPTDPALEVLRLPLGRRRAGRADLHEPAARLVVVLAVDSEGDPEPALGESRVVEAELDSAGKARQVLLALTTPQGTRAWRTLADLERLRSLFEMLETKETVLRLLDADG